MKSCLAASRRRRRVSRACSSRKVELYRRGGLISSSFGCIVTLSDIGSVYQKDAQMSTEQGVGDRNKELFRRLLEEGFGGGNVDVVDELFAPDYREHQPGFSPGPEGVKGAIRYLHGAF